MNEAPVVQYMILCEDARFEGPLPGQLNIYGLMLRQRSNVSVFPVRLPTLCAFVTMRNGRGIGIAKVTATHEDTGLICWASSVRQFDFGYDPLEFRGAYFRGKNVVIPAPGVFRFEFWYNGILVATQTLDVLGS
jgi:hypothetical protein